MYIYVHMESNQQRDRAWTRHLWICNCMVLNQAWPAIHIRFTWKTKTQNIILWDWSRNPPNCSHFHRKIVYDCSRELIQKRLRATSPNNQDHCRISNYALNEVFPFTGISTPLHTILDVFFVLCHIFRFSDWLYFYPMVSRRSFFCISWHSPRKLSMNPEEPEEMN